MNKPPAFQFYADDFLAGTFDMTTADVGAYIRLLCHQWNRGSIPVEPEKQQRLAGGSVSVDVIAKFKVCQDGLLRNERLEVERKKQSDFRRKQSEKGIKSGESRRNSIEQRFNRGSTVVEPRAVEPDVNSPSPSPSPSSSSKESLGIVGYNKGGECKTVSLSKAVEKKTTQSHPVLGSAVEKFERFWSEYPKKFNRTDAEHAFVEVNACFHMPQISDAIRAGKASKDWQKNSGQYIPNPATWLRNQAWNNHVDMPDAYVERVKRQIAKL